jgi:hypothetical protein
VACLRSNATGSFTLSAIKQHDLTVEETVAIRGKAITPEKSKKKYSAHKTLHEKSQLKAIRTD